MVNVERNAMNKRANEQAERRPGGRTQPGAQPNPLPASQQQQPPSPSPSPSPSPPRRAADRDPCVLYVAEDAGLPDIGLPEIDSAEAGLTAGDLPAADSAAVASPFERLADELLRQLNQGRDFEALLDSIYDQLSKVVPYNRIAVAIFENNPARLRLISCRSDGQVSLKIGYASRLAGSTLYPLILSGQARIINDLEAYFQEKPQSSSTRLILSEGMRSNLTLPLIADGKPIGVVFFSSRHKQVYTRQHAIWLRRLAGHIAISVEKARWVEELQESNLRLAEANRTKDQYLDLLKEEVDQQTVQLRKSENRYRMLVRLSQLVNASLDVREAFRGAASEIQKLLGCDLISLQLLDHDPGAAASETHFAVRFDHQPAPGLDDPPAAPPAVTLQWLDPPPSPAMPVPANPPITAPPVNAPAIANSTSGQLAAAASLRHDDSGPSDSSVTDGGSLPDDGSALGDGSVPSGDVAPHRRDSAAPVDAGVLDRHWLYEQGMRYHDSWPLVARGRLLGWLTIAARQAPGERQSASGASAWDSELVSEIASQLSIAIDNASAYSKIARLKSELEQQNVYLREELRSDHSVGNILGNSQAMQQVRQAIHQVAQTDSTVLILGETGTGKELIARAIHDQSSRRDKLMVKVNCAALSKDLITSELFGHETGAFTGATGRRIGRFELAQEGTILLDEISEMPLTTQVLLLRVLQERVFERVGGSEPIKVNTRVIAATNRDLISHISNGHFREDLYYRLHVFPIHVPPLRQRKEDIAPLIDHFVSRFSERMNKRITRIPRSTLEQLQAYDWPGNIRELENLIERATIVSPAETLIVDESWLGQQSFGATTAAGDAAGDHAAADPLNWHAIGRASWDEIQRRVLTAVLDAHQGQIYGADGAAAALDLKPTTLYGKLRKLGISRDSSTQ